MKLFWTKKRKTIENDIDVRTGDDKIKEKKYIQKWTKIKNADNAFDGVIFYHFEENIL